MKNLLLIFLTFLALTSFGQIVLEDEVLLKANDTIWTTQDNSPSINLGRPGPNQYWDFSSLSSGIGKKVVLSKSNQSIIPSEIDYDYYVEMEDKNFHLYKTIDEELYEVGVQKPHPFNTEIDVISAYSQPKLIRYSGMKYNDDRYVSSLIYFTINNREIPAAIKAKLPIKADSLRVREEEFQDFHVDAWGRLNLSYEQFEVLKLDLTTYKNSVVEIYSAGKWSRIDKSILDSRNQILKDEKHRYFIFYSNDSKEAIARVEIDETERAINAEFKASEVLGKLVNISSGQKEIILSPNPSYGTVKLELVNIKEGDYTFEIYNVIGKKIWGDQIEVDRKFSSYKYDFSFLGKGTYLWALTDKNGFRMTTKRMVIITP